MSAIRRAAAALPEAKRRRPPVWAPDHGRPAQNIQDWSRQGWAVAKAMEQSEAERRRWEDLDLANISKRREAGQKRTPTEIAQAKIDEVEEIITSTPWSRPSLWRWLIGWARR